MKSPWSVVLVVAAIALLRIAQANSDEPEIAPAPQAADPMQGKKSGEVRDDNGLKMKLVWCSQGIFTMENIEIVEVPAAEEKRHQQSDDEFDAIDEAESEPQLPRKNTKVPVKVFLSKGYWLGKYEVTQFEWKQVMGTEPWKGKRSTRNGAQFPVTYVDWNDVTDFCRKLTEQERQAGRLSNGWEYTLPTEAQWERACRAGTETKFSFGDDSSKLGDYAWFDGNTSKAGEQHAQQVGQKLANSWGLFDMHGNVWEWCRDIYIEKLPGGRDPEVKPGEDTAYTVRAYRGGSWYFEASGCRSGFRLKGAFDYRSRYLGFSLALSPIQ